MAGLDLAFLGDYRATLDGEPISGFESAKVRALLAYLAVEAEHPHRREALAALLWPERPEAGARANLSQALFNLRSTLGDRRRTPPLLVVTAQTIGLNSAAGATVDVISFTSLLQACAKHPHPQIEMCEVCRQRLQEAVALYGGSFLEDLSVDDSVSFEEWVLLKREHLHRLVMEALGWLTAGYERRGEYAQGLRYAWRQVALDPWREEAQRQVMRLLALSGQRTAALAQYRVCCELLDKELGVEPAAETGALYEQIRQGLVVALPRPVEPAAPAPLEVVEGPETDSSELPRPLFVARERELAHLERWLAQARRGQGRVGFVVGEPGSGKTALLREFAHRAMETPPDLIVAGGACNAYSGLGDPYLPFVEILRLLTGDFEAYRAAGALSREYARRLQGIAPVALQAVLQVAPALIDTLLSGAVLLKRARALPDGAAWAARVQEAISHRASIPSQAFLFDQVTRVLEAVAESHPLLLILDDLQWADAASVGLLFQLGRRLANPGSPGPRMLVLGAYRPEEVAAGSGVARPEGLPRGFSPWGSPREEAHPLAAVLCELQALCEDSTLDLAQAEDRAFIDALVDSEPNRLGVAFREALYRRTGGHALFSAELLHGLQERGDLVRDPEDRWVEGPVLDWNNLPKRVEAVIAAHIARLSREEQELLSVASVEGEEFHAEVAARVLHADERQVLASLSGAISQEHRLVRAESLRRIGEQRFSRYRFRHYLFQHYLYQRLDPVRRAYLHGEVGVALEGLGGVASGGPNAMDSASLLADTGEDLRRFPEGIVSEVQLAWHWEEAGLAERAAHYHMLAGRRAIYFSFSFDDMLSHYVQALRLLATLPENPRRTRWEQIGYQTLGVLLAKTKGFMIPEVGRAFRKSLELAEQIGDEPLVAEALTWMAYYRRSSGELDAALGLSQRAMQLAQSGPPGWAMSQQRELARTLQLHGDFGASARLLMPHAEVLLGAGSLCCGIALTTWLTIPGTTSCSWHTCRGRFGPRVTPTGRLRSARRPWRLCSGRGTSSAAMRRRWRS